MRNRADKKLQTDGRTDRQADSYIYIPPKQCFGGIKTVGKGEIARYEQFLLFPQGTAHMKQEGHDGPVSLHWLMREIHSYQTLHYLGIGLKHKTPYKDYIRQP